MTTTLRTECDLIADDIILKSKRDKISLKKLIADAVERERVSAGRLLEELKGLRTKQGIKEYICPKCGQKGDYFKGCRRGDCPDGVG